MVLTTSDEDQDRIEAYRLNVAGYILHEPVTFTNFAEVMAPPEIRYWALVVKFPSLDPTIFGLLVQGRGFYMFLLFSGPPHFPPLLFPPQLNWLP